MMLNPLIPYASFTQYTPALPEFYWNVYSSEQRIKEICCNLQKVMCYASYLANVVSEISENVDEKLEETLKQVDNELESLRDDVIRMIKQLQMGFLQWDVQTGNYQTTVEAQRDMFNDVTLHSYSVGQLDDVFDELGMSVDGLANCGLNVKGFAVFNHALKHPEVLTDDLVPENPTTEGALTVNGLSSALLDTDGYVFVN